MKNLPKTLIRIDGGEEFVLNKNGTYSLKASLEWKKKGHLIHEWSYDVLMENIVNKGAFKIADGTEDLVSMKKAYWKKIKDRNDFCDDGGF